MVQSGVGRWPPPNQVAPGTLEPVQIGQILYMILSQAGTICNPNGMKYYVEVIRMQVDNIVTRHLHRGQCIALQDAHFHGKGKKVKSTYLNTV